MKYNYKILICKNGEWCEMGAQCQDVTVVTDMINEQFGYQIVTRDSVYNYLQRPHVSNKRVFNKVVRVERTRVVSKRQRAKTSPHAKTKAQCSPETSCQ